MDGAHGADEPERGKREGDRLVRRICVDHRAYDHAGENDCQPHDDAPPASPTIRDPGRMHELERTAAAGTRKTPVYRGRMVGRPNPAVPATIPFRVSSSWSLQASRETAVRLVQGRLKNLK